MLYEVYQRLDHSHQVSDRVILDSDVREKGRFKAVTEQGVELRVFLERGKTLIVGEILVTECGQHIEILGANEALSIATCDDWETFSKACYHLGNRHVKVQVGDRCLWIKPDYVLEEMLELLGLQVSKTTATFIPESGAYAGGHKHH